MFAQHRYPVHVHDGPDGLVGLRLHDRRLGGPDVPEILLDLRESGLEQEAVGVRRYQRVTQLREAVIISGLSAQQTVEDVEDQPRDTLRLAQVRPLVAQDQLVIVTEVLQSPQLQLGADSPGHVLQGAHTGHHPVEVVQQAVCGQGAEQDGQRLVIGAGQQDQLRESALLQLLLQTSEETLQSLPLVEAALAGLSVRPEVALG